MEDKVKATPIKLSNKNHLKALYLGMNVSLMEDC